VQAAREAGADFGVSPGVNRRVLEEAAKAKFPFAPGVATPTDIETALGHDCKLLKFFPAEQIGGLPYLRAISAPYDHLGVQYIPLGGLNEQLMTAYLERPNVAAIGGSWMVTPELVAAGQWDKVATLARQAVAAARRARGTSK
jgi:2-dehydro-3-deoxyphosphogluconate aldolase/(4S)-4-hydroxy-2-oxoglutarate aldolase